MNNNTQNKSKMSSLIIPIGICIVVTIFIVIIIIIALFAIYTNPNTFGTTNTLNSPNPTDQTTSNQPNQPNQTTSDQPNQQTQTSNQQTQTTSDQPNQPNQPNPSDNKTLTPNITPEIAEEKINKLIDLPKSAVIDASNVINDIDIFKQLTKLQTSEEIPITSENIEQINSISQYATNIISMIGTNLFSSTYTNGNDLTTLQSYLNSNIDLTKNFINSPSDSMIKYGFNTIIPKAFYSNPMTIQSFKPVSQQRQLMVIDYVKGFNGTSKKPLFYQALKNLNLLDP
jgi:flagellar basal body-associated protein FliL